MPQVVPVLADVILEALRWQSTLAELYDPRVSDVLLPCVQTRVDEVRGERMRVGMGGSESQHHPDDA